jgi:leucyl aminopeptidase
MTKTLQFSVQGGAAAASKKKTDCLIVAVFEEQKLSAAATEVDRASGGQLKAVLRRGDLEGKPGQTLMLHHVHGVAAERVLLVGCGAARAMSDARFRKAAGAAVAKVAETGAKTALNLLPLLDVEGRDLYWKSRCIVETARDNLFRFDQLKSKKPSRTPSLQTMTLVCEGARDVGAAERGIHDGEAIASGIELARELGNMPPNICHPSYLAQRAAELGRRLKSLKVSWLDEPQMKKLGMNTLLAVSRGSRQPPRLIVIEYKGARTAGDPIALVGKGVTFDTGGISLKPGAQMDEMKFDMSGAGSVIGTMAAIAQMKLPLNVVGVVPAVENMPGGNATRPADIVTSLSGQTVEILNTDAEGRLILCDAITYVERKFKPKAVVDIATLTGACVIALGNHASGLFSNHQPLADALLAAGQRAGDRAWQMPLWEEYQAQLDSPFADMANIGGREGGAITAACFLARFARNLKWAHLDVAGTAYRGGKAKGSTGRPVPLLVQFLIDSVGSGGKKGK